MEFEQILIIAKNGFQIPIENLKKEKQVEILNQIKKMRYSICNSSIDFIKNDSFKMKEEYIGGLVDAETKYLLLFDLGTLDFVYDILKESNILQEFFMSFPINILEFSKKFAVKITKDKFK